MTRTRRGWIWLAMVCGGVTLYQGIGFTTGYLPLFDGIIGGQQGTGCARFTDDGVVSSIDFCYLLDCQNGFFGGIIDPCPGGTGDLLVDCPTTGTTAGTTNAGTTTGTGTGT
jgi:hypothetical protein